MSRRIRLTVQYDGSAYHGWQFQPSGTTIQGVLQDCIYQVTGEQVRVLGAGRTDAHVHAVEQIAAFDADSSLDIGVIKRALNARLPSDVRVVNIEEVAADFHPRYSAKGKRYVYLIANMRDVPVFVRRYVWRVKEPLGLEEMRTASIHLLGLHDFSSFRAAGCASRHPLRTIREIAIERLCEAPFLFGGLEGEFVRITVEADAFLRHMVRTIVGTLVEVGKGNLHPEAVRDILERKERRFAGPTAPPQGLFLKKIFY
ncbi:MAG TPA: tRNA pseudouridine(38-40) synthase TruA [Thermodesulfovibrionales bacterium]|nr:tRNA pseudouridine(38-40) synthase TruA [Thermodesulfovibrionales bacterium]